MVSAPAGPVTLTIVACASAALLVLWFVLGVGTSITETPGGRLLRRSAYPEHRSAVFAAQFALSHARWLLTYPVSGWVARGGEAYTSLALAGISVAAVVTTLILWPREGCRGRARPSRAQLRPPASARDSGRRADIRPRASDRH